MEKLYTRFCMLRKKLFELISYSLEFDNISLEDEGALEVKFFFPNYYDFTYVEPTGVPEKVEICLNCYTLGNKRFYRWRGKSFEDVLDKLEKTLTEWENAYS